MQHPLSRRSRPGPPSAWPWPPGWLPPASRSPSPRTPRRRPKRPAVDVRAAQSELEKEADRVASLTEYVELDGRAHTASLSTPGRRLARGGGLRRGRGAPRPGSADTSPPSGPVSPAATTARSARAAPTAAPTSSTTPPGRPSAAAAIPPPPRPPSRTCGPRCSTTRPAPAPGPSAAAELEQTKPEDVLAPVRRSGDRIGRQFAVLRPVRGPVHGDDGGAAEAEVVLEGDLRAVDLALVGLAAQLPVELGALGQPGGADRVALRDAGRPTG